MANPETLIRSIEVLEDGELRAIIKKTGNPKYLSPKIVVDTRDDIKRLTIRDENNDTVLVDVTIDIIDGVSFSGTFEDLETEIRNLVAKSNGLLFAGGNDDMYKESFFSIGQGSANLPNDVTDGFSFEYWDSLSQSYLTYSKDIIGETINDLSEMASLLNDGQNFFEFYVLPGNIFPGSSDIGIKSKDKDVESEFKSNSFFLEIDGAAWDDTPLDIGRPLSESNGDELIKKADDIILNQQQQLTKNNINHGIFTNPANVDFTGFRRLSFSCTGTITVTLNGVDVVYPLTVGGTGELRYGETYEVSDGANTINFNGTGTLFVHYTI